MNKTACRRALCCCGALLGFFVQSQVYAQPSTDANCRKEIEKSDRADKTGPLSIYQLADEKVLIEIKSEDLEKEFIFANYIDRGVTHYVGEYADPKLITFRLNGKKIDVIEKDSVGFFNKEDALSRTRVLTMSDAVISSLKLHKCQPVDTYFAYIDQSVLTKLSSDFLRGIRGGAAQIAAEMKDWRTYSDNINFISEHRLSSSRGSNFSIRVRHILLQRPESDFDSRRADARVGYFTVKRRDLGDIDQSAPDTYIYKWRLDKKDPGAALSAPVKPIVFWIENTTPEKFRPYIKQGVLAWNEAFRVAGFLNAIEVYEQPVDADWEAGDISKNVIRWQAAYRARSGFGFAPAIHDPLTGEILGADILLNYSGIGDYLDDWIRLSGEDSLTQQGALDVTALQRDVHSVSLTPSKILNGDPPSIEVTASHLEGSYILASLVEDNQEFSKTHIPTLAAEKTQSLTTVREASHHPQKTLLTGAVEAPPTEEDLGFADRMVKEVITQLTMHEVGHALGLTHNFRGSRWRSMDEIFDRSKTNGMISASVMDYLPINFSPIGIEQGDFANTRLGPYDIWAVEFGYRPGLSEAERRDILQRALKAEYAFGIRAVGSDPHTLQYDLTDTAVDYAKSYLTFASEVTRLASLNNAFENRVQYLSLFQELQARIYLSVFAISAQMTPFTLGVAQAGDSSSDYFQTVNVHSKSEQKAALKALEQLIFTTDAVPLAEEFVFRLGHDRHAAEALPVDVKRVAISQLMNERSLLFRYRASELGGEYGPTELLFDIKHAIFGSDLLPFARQRQDRRNQQIIFAYHLAGLITDNGEPARYGNFERSIVSAAARPVRNALLRDLLIPIPWAPRDVRAHRQELRAILR